MIGDTVAELGSCEQRRNDVQPIRRDLADAVRSWLIGKPAGEFVFRDLPADTARMLRRDMKFARATWIDEARTDEEREARRASEFLLYRNAAGRVCDFHATRHTYISAIVNGGASVKVAQESARHSTPTLTIGRYSHTRLHDLTGALDALPDLNPRDERPTQERQRATGTYGDNAQRQAQRAGRETLRIGAAPSERGSENATDPDRAKTLKFSEKNEPTRPNASSCENYPYGDSNPGFRTENPTS